MLGDTKQHTHNFKTAAEAALVKRQNQKNRKRKRETDQKDPTFQTGMKLTVPYSSEKNKPEVIPFARENGMTSVM